MSPVEHPTTTPARDKSESTEQLPQSLRPALGLSLTLS